MESIGANLSEMQRTPLAAAHVAALREAGRQVSYPAGTYLARAGQCADCFVYVLEGEIEVVTQKRSQVHLQSFECL